MNLLALLLIIVVLTFVVAVVSAPLRAKAAGRQPAAELRDAQERRDLEIEKEQKYAEIRELEMDLRTGKLNEADYRTTDRQLRAEAVDILDRLDRLGAPAEAPDGTPAVAPDEPPAEDPVAPAEAVPAADGDTPAA